MNVPVKKAKSVQSSRQFRPEPPRIPESKAELERLLCLLGNRTKASLNRKAQEELVALVGIYPSPKEASAWKQYLKAQMKPSSGVDTRVCQR